MWCSIEEKDFHYWFLFIHCFKFCPISWMSSECHGMYYKNIPDNWVIFGLVFHELQWQVTRNPDVELLFFFYIVPPLPTAKCRQNRTLIELTRPLMNTESKYPNIQLSNETTWYQNAFSRIILWPAPASFTCL